MEFSFLFGQFLGGLTTAMFLFLIASGLLILAPDAPMVFLPVGAAGP